MLSAVSDTRGHDTVGHLKTSSYGNVTGGADGDVLAVTESCSDAERARRGGSDAADPDTSSFEPQSCIIVGRTLDDAVSGPRRYDSKTARRHWSGSPACRGYDDRHKSE